MRKRGSKFMVFFVFLITVVLGGVAVWIGWRLQQEDDVTPEESEAASEEVWNAERTDLQNFADGWQEVKNLDDFDFQKAKSYALSEGGSRFDLEAEIMKVDEETLYGRDLNYYFIIYAFPSYISADRLPEPTLDFILDILITDSFLIQEASKMELLSLDTSVYNSNIKDFQKRNLLVTKAKDSLGDKLVQKISFEYVSIWFKNTEVPISVESGREVAEQKINTIYERLKNNEITMQEAGEIIINDSEIGEKCDPAWKSNAYSIVENFEKSIEYFTNEDLEKSLWSLAEGQMSTVVVAKDSETGEEMFFIIIKVNTRSHQIDPSGEVYQGLDDMVNKKLEEGESKSEKIIKNK